MLEGKNQTTRTMMETRNLLKITKKSMNKLSESIKCKKMAKERNS